MDIFLKGNGHWCADCGGTGRARFLRFIPGHPMIPRDRIPIADLCPSCRGEGRRTGQGPNRPDPSSTKHVLVVTDLMTSAKSQHDAALLSHPTAVHETDFEARVQALNENHPWQKGR